MDVAESETEEAEVVPQWPAPMAAAAFYGLAGGFVDRCAPHTEAGPQSLLAQFLLPFGAAPCGQ